MSQRDVQRGRFFSGTSEFGLTEYETRKAEQCFTTE